MGRPKKNESSALVEIVNDYYETEARGNIRKLKYSNLAKHAEKKGIRAAWYDFQRDPAVLQKIADLKALEQPALEISIVPAYKNLDIEALLNQCGTLEELKRKLFELDQYWKKTYDEAVKTAEEDRSLAGKQQELEQDMRNLSQKLEEAETKAKRLEQENAYLRRMIRDNLYPAIANELLRQTNLPVPENDTVCPDALSHLVEGNAPQPIGGSQEPQKRALTKQEQLLADMQIQVRKNGQKSCESGSE